MKTGAVIAREESSFAVAAIAVLTLGFFLDACRFCGNDTPCENEQGQAGLAFNVPWRRDFKISANLSLPSVPSTKSWYCIWIMIAEMKGTAKLPAMVQGGLMRWEDRNFRLRPFLAFEHSGRQLRQDNNLPLFPGGAPQDHQFAIVRKGARLQILMDDKPLFEDAWHSYFRDDEKIYVKIAAEVATYGDTISGKVRRVELITSSKIKSPFTPFTVAEDRGLHFLCDNYEYTAVGKFDPKLPFRWTDSSCTGLGKRNERY